MGSGVGRIAVARPKLATQTNLRRWEMPAARGAPSNPHAAYVQADMHLERQSGPVGSEPERKERAAVRELLRYTVSNVSTG